MKTKKSKTPFPLKVTGNGSSLWGKSDDEYTVKKGEVGYINWMHYSDNDSLFASLSLFGTMNWFQYTNKQIEKQLNENICLKEWIITIVKEKLATKNLDDKIPSNVKIGWSEQGMQPDGGWNFDVSFLN